VEMHGLFLLICHSEKRAILSLGSTSIIH